MTRLHSNPFAPAATHGLASVADETGTTPRRASQGFDAAELDAFNAGTSRAVHENRLRDRCRRCGEAVGRSISPSVCAKCLRKRGTK